MNPSKVVVVLDWLRPDTPPSLGDIGFSDPCPLTVSNVGVQAYYNAERPNATPSPSWQLKLQFSLLYPKKPKAP